MRRQPPVVPVLLFGVCGLSCLLFAPTPLLALDDELPPAAKRNVDFVKDIKPLLQKHCVACHGTRKQESGLRLDRKDKALAGGDRGVAFEAGKSARSLLIRYVAGLDPDITMPPEGDLLSKQQVGLLRAWIDQGTQWPKGLQLDTAAAKHWAYEPLRRPAPPAVPAGWAAHAKSPLDAFVLARLARQKLTPSATTDRFTLIRRLSLDLLGLPPSPRDVDAFLKDASPRAYEHLVDSMLKSPHFGERWGRHWLDKARYADSDGYEKDRPRPNAWRWRDWVIDAINRDLPFDRFTVEQLAGDLLTGASESQQLATAFHRQTLTNTEGGTDKEQWRIEAVFDRVETTGIVWLGLTVGCARCHSHKYDQISQREYYQIFAFYNNGDEVDTQVTTSQADQAKFVKDLATHKQKLQTLTASLAAARKKTRPALEKWIIAQQAEIARIAGDPIRDVPLADSSARGPAGVTLSRGKDRAWLVGGKNPVTADYTITGQLETPRLTGLRLELLTDKSLPKRGPGRAANGNLVLQELTLELSADKSFAKPLRVVLKRASADYSQKGFAAALAIDGKPKTGWAVGGQVGRNHTATFFAAEPVVLEGPRYVRIRLVQAHGGNHTLGKFRLTPLTGSQPPSGLPATVQSALAAAAKGTADKKQLQALEDHYASVDKATAPLVKQLAELSKKPPQPPRMTVRVIRQRSKDPRTTYVLNRGDFLRPQKETAIRPDTLATLPPVTRRKPKSPGDRLDLANWLVSDKNPLVPRVAVNQIWSHLFGKGLVGTINDFGVRGDPPTHPRLLDWLATEYRRLKWSRKALIKTIVLSATYRQDSAARPQQVRLDVGNRWLSRQNRFRVEAEIIRDTSLSVAGLLSNKIGGKSVFPPMPADVAALSYANNFKWNTSKGDDRFRRGLYTFFKRTAPHPNLTTFDCPDSNTTCVQRRASNTPLQALTTLNNEVFVEASRGLARRVLTEADGSRPTRPSPTGQDAARLTRAFRLCVARPPSTPELESFAGLLAAARKWYQDHEPGARTLVGEYATKDVAVSETAAWVATCRIMLNMDEFITRE